MKKGDDSEIRKRVNERMNDAGRKLNKCIASAMEEDSRERDCGNRYFRTVENCEGDKKRDVRFRS